MLVSMRKKNDIKEIINGIRMIEELVKQQI